MINFIKIDEEKQQEIDREVFNSNNEYTQIAYDKEQLEHQDIVLQYQEAKELELERFLIEKDNHYIGILEYGMSSPRDKKPWLSLLIIDKRYQGLGYAKKSYLAYEQMMIDKGVTSVQIAVHANNEKAYGFWRSLGFIQYDERFFENKHFYSLEKYL
jgi:GNAT superfamily N-acetyltransferase